MKFKLTTGVNLYRFLEGSLGSFFGRISMLITELCIVFIGMSHIIGYGTGVLVLFKLVRLVFVSICFFYVEWLVEVIWSFYKSFSSKGSSVTQRTICSMFGGIVVMVDCSIVFGLWESFVVVMIWCLGLFCRFVSFLVMLASILFYQNMVIKMLKEYYKNHPKERKFYYIMWVCLVSLNCFIIIVLFFFFL